MLCKHHMVRGFPNQKEILVNHPGNQSNETNGSAVMWATQEEYASDLFLYATDY